MANPRILLRTLNCLAVVLALCLCPLCFGESVIVRVLNGSDGKPVADQFVTMQLHFAKPGTMMTLNVKTDDKGEARFQLPNLTPESLEVELELSHAGLHCPHHVFSSTESVMHQGLMIAARVHGSKLSAPIQTAPGHIVFVAQPSVRWETVLFGE